MIKCSNYERVTPLTPTDVSYRYYLAFDEDDPSSKAKYCPYIQSLFIQQVNKNPKQMNADNNKDHDDQRPFETILRILVHSLR